MKKDVLITFDGKNTYHHGNHDKLSFTTKGDFIVKDNKCYLKYQEVLGSDDNNNALVTLKIEKDKLTILRYGENNSQLVLEKGKKHLNHYETPQGSFTIGVSPNNMDINIEEYKGCINVDYNIELNNVLSSRNNINVSFKEVQ